MCHVVDQLAILSLDQYALALYGHAIQLISVGLHGNGAQVMHAALAVDGFIAHIADAGQYPGLLHWDDKHATLVAHTAGDVGRIDGIEHGHIGVCEWLPVLVNESSLEMIFGLLDALHIDFVPVSDRHLDGVEPDELLHCLGHGFALDLSGDTEVFQFVEQEVDGISGI